MKIKFTGVLFLTYIIIGQIHAQVPTSSFSLAEAIAFAKENNPGILNAKTDIVKARAQVKEIRAIGLPQVNGSFQANDYIQLPASFIPLSAFNPQAPKDQYQKLVFGTQWQIQTGITASQLVFDGTYLVGLQAAKELINLYQHMEAKTLLDVEIQVTKAYYQVLTLAENIKLLDVNIERLKKLSSDLEAIKKQGLIEATDLDKVVLALSNLEIQKENIVNMYDLSLKVLKMSMGMEITREIVLTDQLESLYDKPENAEIPSFDIQNRPEYKLLKMQYRLNELDKKRYIYSYLPNLAVFGSYNLSLNRNNDNLFKKTPQLPWIPVTLIGLKANVPIFDGLMKKYKTEQIILAQQKLTRDEWSMKQGFDLEYASARNRYMLNVKITGQHKKNMMLAAKILSDMQIKHREGLITTTDLMTAETDLKSAQTAYLNSIYDLLNARCDLKKSTGK